MADLCAARIDCDNAAMSDLLTDWKRIPKVVIGMVHLPPLPGSPRYAGSWSAVRDAALRDAEALADGGVHGLMIENFNDVPFYPDRVPAHTVACMTAIAAEIARRFKLPLGINVLRNDGRSALAVAAASGAQFIRVNVLCGARLADQGILHGIAHDLLRDRRQLAAEQVKILADVDVKHSAPLAQRDLADEVEDTLRRGLADAVIVSGAGTGKVTAVDKVQAVKRAAGGVPVFVGSVITPQSIADYMPHADGFIVGTALKRNNVVQKSKVRQLMQAITSSPASRSH